MREMTEDRMDEVQGGLSYECLGAITLASGIGGVFGGGIGFIAGGLIAYHNFC